METVVEVVVAAVVVVPVVALVVSALRGRTKVRACCPADPRLDRRMDGA